MIIPYKDINPTRRPPAVTVTLIAVNAAIFLLMQTASLAAPGAYQAIINEYGLIPSHFFSDRLFELGTAAPVIIKPFTAMFLHGGLFHLAGNMLYLWIFGNNVEDYLGHVKFLFFYLVTGLVAALSYMIIEYDSAVPMVGASGAVAGVMGAYLMLWPHARVRSFLFLFFFITIIEVPAVLLLGVWIFIQVMNSVAACGVTGDGGGVAWFAHVGGFFAGLAIIRRSMKRRGVKRGPRIRIIH